MHARSAPTLARERSPAKKHAGVAILGGTLACLICVDARADDQFQGTFQASLGYTDNVYSSPSEPVPDIEEKTGDFLGLFSPGVVYASASDGQSHRATYAVTGSLFFKEFSASRFSNRLEYKGFFDLTPDIALVVGAGAAQDYYHTTNRFVDVTATVLRSSFPGTASFIAARAEEGLSFELGRSWRARQTTALGMQIPIFRDGSFTLNWANALGLEYVWTSNGLGPEVRADYTLITDAVGPGGVALGDQKQLITGGVMRWRHDFGEDFTSSAEAGALHVNRLSADESKWFPTGAATLAYARREGAAELGYRHTVTTNLFLAQVLRVNEVSLHGAIPLDHDQRLWLGASGGYQDGRLLNADGTLATPVDVILADAGVAFRLEDEISLLLRYQFVKQFTEAELPPLPLSYTRNTIMAGLLLEYPRDEELPREYRPPRRVDGADALEQDLRVPGTQRSDDGAL